MDPQISPAFKAVAITPNDTALLNARALYVGVAGDVQIITAADQNPCLFKNVPAGSFLPVHAWIVQATNTTATNIVALY